MTMDDERQVMDDVAAALDRMKRQGDAVIVTTRKGVVLRCRSVSPRYMEALAEQFKPPAPPTVHVPDLPVSEAYPHGRPGWDEENPNDPEYKRQVEDLEKRENAAKFRLLFGMGTEIVSVPDDVIGVDDDAWIDYVRRAEKFTGVEVPIDVSDPDMRYISWLSFYVLDSNADFYLAGLLPLHLAGLQEVEIANAIVAFRGLPERGADPDLPASAASPNGHRPDRAARRRS